MSAAPHHTGHRHQAAIYHSDAEFLEMVLPLVRAGIDAGEPTLVTAGPHRSGLLRESLGPAAGDVRFLDERVPYLRPSSTLETYRGILSRLMAAGPERIRVVGGIPARATRRTWSWWARYEAATNRVHADFPVWLVCCYDARHVGAGVLADVRRTHPYLTTTDGRARANPAFEDDVTFRHRNQVEIDALEATPAFADLVDPDPREARAAARAVAHHSGCGQSRALALEVAVNETVTNARLHGVPPVRLRLWWAPGRVVATITDGGSGPDDPRAGLVRTTSTRTGGLGLWLAHETCDYVRFSQGQDGFTVGLFIGEPEAAA